MPNRIFLRLHSGAMKRRYPNHTSMICNKCGGQCGRTAYKTCDRSGGRTQLTRLATCSKSEALSQGEVRAQLSPPTPSWVQSHALTQSVNSVCPTFSRLSCSHQCSSVKCIIVSVPCLSNFILLPFIMLPFPEALPFVHVRPVVF